MQKTSNFTHPYLHKSNNCCTFAAVFESAMKRRILIITTLCLLCAGIRAESITTTQDFSSMASLGTLTFTLSNTVGTTDFVTYTCSGTNAEFGADHVYRTKISIRLPKNGSTVTTSRIDELKEILIKFYPSGEYRPNLRVQLSRDGETWGDPLTGDKIDYTSTGDITVTIPRNNYYVRIRNNSSTKEVSIVSITYYQDHCNCFTYEP